MSNVKWKILSNFVAFSEYLNFKKIYKPRLIMARVRYTNSIDQFFNLYAIIITVIILPSFYLNGEAAFRRNLAIYGSFKAMKNAIFGKM